jgi:hypothetical protein
LMLLSTSAIGTSLTEVSFSGVHAESLRASPFEQAKRTSASETVRGARSDVITRAFRRIAGQSCRTVYARLFRALNHVPVKCLVSSLA